MRKFTGLSAAAAIVITTVGLSAAPAEARGYGHGGWGYRHRDGVDAGDVIGGLLILGTIAAVASAASKDNQRNREQRYEPPYQPPQRDAPYYEPRNDSVPYDSHGGADVRPYGSDEESRAADACSWAVEGEMGNDARVESITDARPANGGGGWYVTGNASRGNGETQSFGCSFKGGRVVDVSFG